MKKPYQQKSSFMIRNNSLPKKPAHRINSLQQQLNQSGSFKPKTPQQLNPKQQSSAVMQLLQMKDQNDVEWQEHNNNNNTNNKNENNHNRSSHFIRKGLVHSSHLNNNNQQLFSNNKQHNKPDFRQQHQLLWAPSNLEDISTIAGRHNYYHQEDKSSLIMNQTQYLDNSSHNFSLTQKINRKLLLNHNQTFYQKKHSENNMRVNSHLEFYRNKSPSLQKQHSYQQLNDMKMSLSNNINYQTTRNPIKILPNKSITVRQMLDKINSHQNINITSSEQQCSSMSNHKLNINKLNNLLIIIDSTAKPRQPFDPYHTKKTPRQQQHYKKFTPFKIQQQRKIQNSLQKLQQHIRKNPQLDDKNRLEQIELKFLEKPTYCSWVERNKDRIKRKGNCPLTVRPLKMVN